MWEVCSLAERQKQGKMWMPDGWNHFQFNLVSIPYGAVIHFARNPSITAKVVSEKRVLFEGKFWSLSALAQHLLGVPYGVRGPQFFTYNGELLSDLWSEAVKRFAIWHTPPPHRYK